MKIVYCTSNIDTASVELRFDDGTEISVYAPGVDDERCPTVPMQA